MEIPNSSALVALKTRLNKLLKISSWTSIAFGNQKLRLILSDGSVTLDWFKRGPSI
jgi:hypothetical protein